MNDQFFSDMTKALNNLNVDAYDSFELSPEVDAELYAYYESKFWQPVDLSDPETLAQYENATK